MSSAQNKQRQTGRQTDRQTDKRMICVYLQCTSCAGKHYFDFYYSSNYHYYYYCYSYYLYYYLQCTSWMMGKILTRRPGLRA